MDQFVKAVAFQGCTYAITGDGDVYKFWFGWDFQPLVERRELGSVPGEGIAVLSEPERTT